MFILLPHVHLKATILYTCALISSSRSFYHILGLWHHIMWHVMWLQCHIPLHHPKEKRKENQYKIRKIKEKKNKIVSVPVSHNIFSIYYVLLWIPSTVLSTLLLLLFFIYLIFFQPLTSLLSTFTSFSSSILYLLASFLYLTTQLMFITR